MTLPKMPDPRPTIDEKGRVPRPPFDPASAFLTQALPVKPLTLDQVPTQRAIRLEGLGSLQRRFAFVFGEEVFTTDDGEEHSVAVFKAPGLAGAEKLGPCFLFIHGGGMVAGTEFDCGGVMSNLEAHGGLVASITYRLAPEHRAPVPLEDCYAAYLWMHENAARLGGDPARIILIGGSAGGGLAMGVALLARDRGAPRALAVQLDCPMADDRCNTVSQHQFDALGMWSRQSSLTGWGALLGPSAGGPNVSPYVAPARATWLGDLPPILITVGSADPFRDEDVALASSIWRDGGDCELHVVPGGFHGHETFATTTAISKAYRQTVALWVQRQLNPDGPEHGPQALKTLGERAAGKG